MTEERESWGNHIEFFLSSLGLAVGLGNVWRFPYIAFENGGGSFLIPYVLALLLVGMPAFFLELSAGQYGRVGANKLWGRMVPAMKGLGYGMLLVRFLVNIYYVVICAWAMIYLVEGFQSTLPWGTCGDLETNTRACYTKVLNEQCQTKYNNTLYTYYNSSMEGVHQKDGCISYQAFCESFGLDHVGTPAELCIDVLKGSETFTFSDLSHRISPSEDYFNRVVLGLVKDYDGNKHTFEDYGSLKWQIVLALAISWILICLILIKGLKSLGKASYVITLSPYVVLTALIIYGARLEGSDVGMKELFSPKWEIYTQSDSYKVWALACQQILFSLSVGFGSQLVLSSYNEVRNNCHRDALLIGFMNSFTSIFAGIAVFAVLGYLADGGPLEDVVKGGLSLAFVAYPEAVLKMDLPPLWSFLFFFMLINLALSSICGGVQTFLAFILDEFPHLTKHRVKIVIVSCVVFFLAGVPMCTEGGIHLFNIFDKRSSSSLLLLCLLEIILVAWMYGSEKFVQNIEEMEVKLYGPVRIYWKSMWMVICPVVISVVIILRWITVEPMSYDGVEYSAGVQAIGWLFELVPIGVVIAYAIFVVSKKGVKESLKPAPSWETTTAHAILSKANQVIDAFDVSVYKITPANTMERNGQKEKTTEL